MAHAQPEGVHYHYIFDVIKVGSRYQVFDTRDNSPVGKSLPTRADAVEFMREVDAEMELMGVMGHGKDTIEKWLEVEHKASRFKFSPQEAGVGAGETGVAKVS
jgi:hypothetical protein